jgi:hypothetical protein
MRALAVVSTLVLGLGLMAPAASAQSNDNRLEVGGFFDWTKLQFAKLNLFGVGGRVGFNIRPAIAIEAEGTYDFGGTVSQTVTSLGVTTSFASTVRLIDGLAGPKFQTTHGPVRIFAVLKGGVLNFGVSAPVTAGNFANQLGQIKDGDTDGVFYPGVGIEFHIKFLAMRVEGGDEIFFDHGPNHNLKITAGPIFRF